jgi:hypothetical protein
MLISNCFNGLGVGVAVGLGVAVTSIGILTTLTALSGVLGLSALTDIKIRAVSIREKIRAK